MFSSRHHIILALSVLLCQVLIFLPTASGQAPAIDTTARLATDSMAASGDTGLIARADTLDSIPRAGVNSGSVGDRADTTRTTPDSVAPTTRDSTRRPAAAMPAAPVDSILSAACGGRSGATSIARDLLVLVFAPEAGPAERAAAAKRVNGRLTSSGEPGVYYVRLPRGGGEAELRAAADDLSRLPQVRQVGTRACPPLEDRAGLSPRSDHPARSLIPIRLS